MSESREFCRDHHENTRLLKDIHTAVCGTASTPGIAEKVRTLQLFNRGYLWVLTAVIVALLGASAKLFIG